MDQHPTRTAWAALTVLMLAYAALFAVFYPPIAGVEDETGFLNQALVWSHGAVSSEGAGLGPDLADFIAIHGRHVPSRHPGRSLLALPFLAVGGVDAAFASGLLLHLLMTATGAALLSRLGRSPLWAALLLFHPTLALYSRTVMADAPAGAGLLLAALAVASRAPVAAGLAVGLAAAMRYHAAMALPLVAAFFVRTRSSPRRWRDAGVCLLAGAAAGSLLVAYNLAVYGSPTEPFTARRGIFGLAYFPGNATFYGAALLTLWPGMLLAPMFDRSRVGWLTRGVIIIFLGPLLFYYFHDRAGGPLETLVVGLRLAQVTLPLWVVSYAVVVDDFVAAPARRRLGPAWWAVVVTIGCLVMLGGTGVMFARHQHHLDDLRGARDAIVARVPPGSLLLTSGSVAKLVGTPRGVPSYRLRELDWSGIAHDTPEVLDADLSREPGPWFLAVLKAELGQELSPVARALISRQRLSPLPVNSRVLTLFAPESPRSRNMP